MWIIFTAAIWLVLIASTQYITWQFDSRENQEESKILSSLIAPNIWKLDRDVTSIVMNEFIRNTRFVSARILLDDGEVFAGVEGTDFIRFYYRYRFWPVTTFDEPIIYNDRFLGDLELVHKSRLPVVFVVSNILAAILFVLIRLIAGTVEDRKEKQKALIALEKIRSEKALSYLTMRFAHKLNTPVGNLAMALTGALDCVERSGTDLSDAAGLLKTGLDQTKWLSKFSHRIRLLDTVNIPDRLVDDRLDRILRSHLGPLQSGNEHLELKINDSVSPLTVRLYPSVISDVVEEIVTNSIQYGRSEDGIARVTVSIDVDEDRYIISITDDGKGLDPQIQKEIFHNYSGAYRENEKLTFGLQIVSLMVQKNLKGRIDPGPPHTGMSMCIIGPRILEE